MKLYKIFILIVSYFLLTSSITFGAWWVLFRYIPSMDDVRISEMQLLSNVNAIARNHDKKMPCFEVLSSKSKLRVVREDNQDFFENMTEDQRILYTTGTRSIFRNMNPDEVCGIFEIWLFVQNKKTPYEVIAVSWIYTSGGIDNTNSQITTITKPEFEKIYVENTQDIIGLDNAHAAEILMKAWIAETGYVKKDG